MRLLWIPILITATCTLSCSEEFTENDTFPVEILPIVPFEECNEHVSTDCLEQENQVNIRIRNFSRFDLCNIVYQPISEKTNYGLLKSGDSSCYISHESSYGYPYSIDFLLDDTTFNRTALDFTGESLLSPGYYNYNIFMFQDDRIIVGGYYVNNIEDEIPFPINTLDNCIEHNVTDCGLIENKVNLRIFNHTVFDLCNVKYENNNNDIINFGNLLAGQISCYVGIENIFENYYQLQMELNNLTLERNNLVNNPSSDDLKSNGNYSLHIAISRLNENGLVLSLQKDN